METRGSKGAGGDRVAYRRIRFSEQTAHAWIANLVGRGRELKKLLENEINVAVLERAHRAPERNSAGTIVVMRDQILNYGHAGAMGAHSSGAVKETAPEA